MSYRDVEERSFGPALKIARGNGWPELTAAATLCSARWVSSVRNNGIEQAPSLRMPAPVGYCSPSWADIRVSSDAVLVATI
jgi:hypothetical protein